MAVSGWCYDVAGRGRREGPGFRHGKLASDCQWLPVCQRGLRAEARAELSSEGDQL